MTKECADIDEGLQRFLTLSSSISSAFILEEMLPFKE